MKKKKLIRVSLSDFNSPELRLAAEEGRLFVQPSEITTEEKRECSILAILRYVSRIDDCASPAYREQIAECWERALRNPLLIDFCFYKHKMRQRHMPNYARVNAIVFLLREKGIYRSDEFNNSALHCLMEGTAKRTNTYMAAGNYYPDTAERKVILECFGYEAIVNNR